MGGATGVTRSGLDQVLDGHGDALYDFALAVTNSPGLAAAVVAEGARAALDEHGAAVSRPTLLGAVFRAAARHAPPALFLDGELLQPGPGSPDDLQRVCRAATQSLDPRDRAILDLSLRQGLEGEALGEALGVSPGQLSATTRSAVETAEHVVGAVLLSRVAQQDCPGLASVLGALPAETDADLLAGVVVGHEEQCTACGDRRRALVSVTSLLAAVPATPAPPRMVAAEPLPPAPDVTPPPARPSPWRRPGLALGAAAGVVLLVAAALALTRGEEEGTTTAPAAGGRLEAPRQPLMMGGANTEATFELANPGSEPLDFTARTGAPWLVVEPAGGRVDPGGAVQLRVVLDRDRAPEGDTANEIRVLSTGGSKVIPVATAVERAPVLSGLEVTPAATVTQGCAGAGPLVARVSVVEESGIERVELHHRNGGGEMVSAMARDGESWTAAFGPFEEAGEIQWWVTAVDIRGNAAASPPQPITVSAC